MTIPPIQPCPRQKSAFVAGQTPFGVDVATQRCEYGQDGASVSPECHFGRLVCGSFGLET